jgi:tRNA 2-thiocytidine biosynthesis protein TtcA
VKKENSLQGSGCELLPIENDLKPLAEIERSLIKKFRKDIWRKFILALQDFNLIEEGDHIAVGVSGGKDSMLLAKLMQEVQRHGNIPFKLSFVSMDPGFHESNRDLLIKNAEHLGIPIHLYESHIFNIVDDVAAEYPCYLCARMRRGSLYEQARALGANKLALGHHFDDVIETIMMNVLYAGTYMTMMPRLHSQNFEGMELIRPLYYVEEDNIKRWASYNGIQAMNCGCIVAAKRTSSKRREVKELIRSLKAINPDVGKSIMKSSQNVHIDAILGFKRRGKDIPFTEYFNKEHFEL